MTWTTRPKYVLDLIEWTERIRSLSRRSRNALSRERLSSSGTCVNVQLPSFPDRHCGEYFVVNSNDRWGELGDIVTILIPRQNYQNDVTVHPQYYKGPLPIPGGAEFGTPGILPCCQQQGSHDSHGVAPPSLRSTSLWPRETDQDRQWMGLANSVSSGISAWVCQGCLSKVATGQILV